MKNLFQLVGLTAVFTINFVWQQPVYAKDFSTCSKWLSFQPPDDSGQYIPMIGSEFDLLPKELRDRLENRNLYSTLYLKGEEMWILTHPHDLPLTKIKPSGIIKTLKGVFKAADTARLIENPVSNVILGLYEDGSISDWSSGVQDLKKRGKLEGLPTYSAHKVDAALTSTIQKNLVANAVAKITSNVTTSTFNRSLVQPFINTPHTPSRLSDLIWGCFNASKPSNPHQTVSSAPSCRDVMAPFTYSADLSESQFDDWLASLGFQTDRSYLNNKKRIKSEYKVKRDDLEKEMARTSLSPEYAQQLLSNLIFKEENDIRRLKRPEISSNHVSRLYRLYKDPIDYTRKNRQAMVRDCSGFASSETLSLLSKYQTPVVSPEESGTARAE